MAVLSSGHDLGNQVLLHPQVLCDTLLSCLLACGGGWSRGYTVNKDPKRTDAGINLVSSREGRLVALNAQIYQMKNKSNLWKLGVANTLDDRVQI